MWNRPSAVWLEQDLKWACATTSSKVCRQPLPWWEVELELQGLEPELGTVWGIAYALLTLQVFFRSGAGAEGAETGAPRELGLSRVWWQSLPWGLRDWGLRGWGCISVPISLLPLMCMPWLAAGLGPERLVTFYWVDFAPSQVCAGMHACSDGSALKPVLLLPECIHWQRIHWFWMPSPWSETRLALEQALFPLHVLAVVGNGSLRLSGDRCRGKRGWSRIPLRTWGWVGVVLVSWAEAKAVFSLLPLNSSWE